MKITVLPDITIRAGLNGENFDAALPLDVENWFQSYKQMWTICESGINFQRLVKLRSDGIFPIFR